MNELVVDASMVMTWLFEDEEDTRADKALVLLEENGGIVPSLWHLETRNSLISAERRGRFAVKMIDELLDALRALPIRTDANPNPQEAFELARVHGLSFYDAIYLELAKRRQGALATLDTRLARAALKEGLEVPYA